jgi:hypothetical protein
MGFSLTGKGAFTGTFHLFKEIMPNGQPAHRP